MLEGIQMLCTRNGTVCVWQPNRWYSIVIPSPNYWFYGNRCIYHLTLIAEYCHYGTVEWYLRFSQYCVGSFTIQSYL